MNLIIQYIIVQDQNGQNNNIYDCINSDDDISGPAADLFTSILYSHYGPPPGFCFDITCDDVPFIDNKKSPDYNVDERVKFVYL